MNWLDALTHLNAESQSHVLMTVLDTRGSSPRDIGTKMVVSQNHIFDTIGGGALEHQSIEIARQLLKENQSAQHTETFKLGKDLKQCCGGVVSVLFEVFTASHFILNIFGAGHIGRALCKVLEDINCRVNLFDSRTDQFNETYAKHIKPIHLTEPEIAVESCTPNSIYLVMTHDHALDQQLCEAILARGDSFYCGVIGSGTKGIKFRQRLKKKGYSNTELSQLTCPMGLSDLKTKQPMEIAVSIMAELLLMRDKQQADSVSQNHNNEESKIIKLENRDS